MNNKSITDDFQNCKNSGLRLLSQRAYTVFNLRNKLSAKNFSDIIIQRTLDYFSELKFLNDRDFAFAYAENKITLNNFSSVKLKNKLQNKGVPDDIINEVLDFYFDNPEKEKELLLEEIEKYLKKKKLDLKDKKNVHKLAFYLFSKGFNESLIRNAIYNNLDI